jgi:platelet-activating factor acetylhydrolase IB subunit alpha
LALNSIPRQVKNLKVFYTWVSIRKDTTSLTHLQILDLEVEVATLQFELDQATSSISSRKNIDPVSWLPGPFAKHTLQSHRASLTCVAFHPTYSSLASGSENCSIKIWDWELGELEETLKGHTRAVLGLDYGGQRGNTILVSCSSDLTVKLWDPNHDYTNIRTLHGHEHSVSSVRFLTPEGNLLVSSSLDTTLRIWDISTGYCVKSIRGQSDWIRHACPSLDGNWLVSCGRDRRATIWDVASGEARATLYSHENFMECCAFAPPSSYEYLAALAGQEKPPPASSLTEFVATESRDKTIKLWDTRGTLIKSLVGHDNWVKGVVFHAGGKYLLSVAEYKTLRCWDLSQDGKLVKTVDDGHGNFVTCIRWAPMNVAEAPNETPDTSDTKNRRAVVPARFRSVIATRSADFCARVFG